MPRHLFTYGTLMVPSVWHRFVRRKTSSVGAAIRGYRRTRICIDTYPVLTPAPQKSEVMGLLYRNITAKEFILLDRYEGEFYHRKTIPVVLESGKVIGAQVYLLKPRYRHLASRESWHLSPFTQDILPAFYAQQVGR